MKKKELNYLRSVYLNNFDIGEGDKRIDEETYEVDKFYDTSGISFLSEWFFDENVHKYTKIDQDSLNLPFEIPTQYCFPDSYQKLNKQIENFHRREGFYCDGLEVFITEGSTPMLASIVLFVKELGFSKIYSISPLYFSIFRVAELSNIPIVPLNECLTYEIQDLVFPKERSVLFITDPIWSIGRHHCKGVFEKIQKWQKETGSLVFVDASFSYTDWYSEKKWEQSSLLDPNLTFRLICPTKTLALNGLRFSYLLCPPEFKKELSRLTCTTIGSSSYYSHKLRPLMFSKMIKREINPVGAFSRDRFNQIKELLDYQGIEYINPDCGFFMFVGLKNFFKKNNFKDNYMWIPNKGLDISDRRYKDYLKLNLMMREKTYLKLLSDLRNV